MQGRNGTQSAPGTADAAGWPGGGLGSTQSQLQAARLSTRPRHPPCAPCWTHGPCPAVTVRASGARDLLVLTCYSGWNAPAGGGNGCPETYPPLGALVARPSLTLEPSLSRLLSSH